MSGLLHDIVNQGAERFGDKEAFRFNGASITYSDLRDQSNALARALVHSGVQTGDRIGLFMPKSLDCAVSIFGIMKAGAAYVSIDPRSAPSRAANLAKDCEMRGIVCDPRKAQSLSDALSDNQPVEFLVGPNGGSVGDLRCVSWSEVRAVGSDPIEVETTSDSLAYIIYTSGSTGEPKGIMHTHKSALAYARSAAALYTLTSDDRLSNHSPLHFDMSTFDYFSGPSVGATTVIIPESHMMLPASLAQLIESERLTVWYSVPLALVQLLLRGGLQERNLSSLRWILFGGEPFPVKHLRDLMSLLPNAQFANVYGPAEVNQCTHFTVPRPESWIYRSYESTGIPIGELWPAATGIIESETREIGEGGEIVQDGDIGELLISTETMMSGYWGKPELTAASIVNRRSADGSVRTYYRTGDLVRTASSGDLLFVGRRDRQVKIRGHRLELDEVEAALIVHESVEECAVIAVDGPEGSKSLAAFVVGQDGIAIKELRQHLASRVPMYAVPARFEIIVDFPRTNTGKIDRPALVAMVQNAVASDTNFDSAGAISRKVEQK